MLVYFQFYSEDKSIVLPNQQELKKGMLFLLPDVMRWLLLLIVLQSSIQPGS